ncbi:MAG: protein-glutamate O-methyltransferase CheR [Anaerolineae bacterium]|nr:protein-glutamate O-methyltransferase CheR [Anaerolineae bacterium]
MEEADYRFVQYKIRKLVGIDLSHYKSNQMQRRLNTYLLRSGYDNWPGLFRAIQDDPVALGELRDYLTINVSSFFRDPDKFERLKTVILPALLRGHPRLRVWSAGCSHGHEPYSLAIVLAELTGLYSRHTILATDIDHSALARAQAGGPYAVAEMENVLPALRDRYFTRQPDKNGADTYWIIEALRRRISFSRHNLLTDDFESDLDFIVCRNVVIYFTAQVKAELYRRFCHALRPGGILFLGGTEVISRSAEIGFEIADVTFYRRKLEPAENVK